MSSEWPKCRLEDVAASTSGAIAIGPFGSRLKSDAYTDSGVALIRGTNLSGSKFFSGDYVYVSEETAAGLGNANVKPNDLVFPHRGNIGSVGLVPDGDQAFAISSSLMKITLDVNRVDPLFMYYFFRTSIGQSELLKNASQVGTPGIATPLTSLRACQVPVPPIEAQREVSLFLGLIDDQIELLRDTNSTLEAIAQAIFKSWFIDFDPVKAKSEGRIPDGIDEATAALFPDSFEESALGAIPKGWSVTTIGGLCSAIFSGGTPSTSRPEYWCGDLRWLSSGETRDSVITDAEKRISPAAVTGSSTRLALPGDVVIASAGQGKTRGQTSYLAIETYINQSVVALRADPNFSSPAWLFYNLNRRYEEMRMLSDSHSIRGSLTTKLLAGMKACVPPYKLIKAFEDLAGSLLQAQAANLDELQTLTELRDTLLPRLISGKLELPKLQEVAEAV